MKQKLSAWAKSEGISYKTAQRWYYEGKLPVPTVKTPTGRIMVVTDDLDDEIVGRLRSLLQEAIRLLEHTKHWPA